MKKKNVIWIFSDQQPAHMLSCNGNPNVSTPNLDRMAENGVNCTSAVAGFPLCCPFRGTLLTSRYPHKCVPGHEYQMPPEMPTIAHTFKEHGYHTGYFGKWHVDGFKERNGRAAMHIIPPERRGGFDTWIGYENNNCQYDCRVHGGEGNDTFHYRLPGYETDCLTDLLLDYLRERTKNPEQPFFAALSVQPPHDPYIAPPEYMARHNPQSVRLRPNVPDIPEVTAIARKFLAGAHAMVENIDWNVGRVISLLEETGISQDTHVIYFSDHGNHLGSHGYYGKTTPLEESIRIPFIIGGGEERYNMSCANSNVVINNVDIAPTTLGLCGITPPDYMEGFDYSPLRLERGNRMEHAPDSAFIQQVVPTGHGNSYDVAWRGVITRDNWKYVAIPNQHHMLFNLNNDPYEQVNHAFNIVYRAKRDELFAKTAEWIAKTGDEFPMPTD